MITGSGIFLPIRSINESVPVDSPAEGVCCVMFNSYSFNTVDKIAEYIKPYLQITQPSAPNSCCQANSVMLYYNDTNTIRPRINENPN